MKVKRVWDAEAMESNGVSNPTAGARGLQKAPGNVHWAKTAWMLKTAGATIKSPLIPFPNMLEHPVFRWMERPRGELHPAAVRVWPGPGAAALSQRSGLMRVGLGDAGRGQAGRLGQGGHGARAPHDTESMSSPSSPVGMFWNTFPQRVQQVCRGDNPDIYLVGPFPKPPGS